jgi:hypothetical protein
MDVALSYKLRLLIFAVDDLHGYGYFVRGGWRRGGGIRRRARFDASQDELARHLEAQWSSTEKSNEEDSLEESLEAVLKMIGCG